VRTGESGLVHGQASDALLKNWLIRHTLLEDRLFKDFFAGTVSTGRLRPAADSAPRTRGKRSR
jgi:hypothetical protein